ncbi:MAG: hypothetical protein AAB567_02715 [Patescibacteria group bacterium]
MIEWINERELDRDDYVLIEVDPVKLIERTVLSENGRPLIWSPKRFQEMLIRLLLGGEIDAPVVSHSTNKIFFVDGRHRTAAALVLGLSTIKVMAHKEEAEAIRLLLLE